MQALFGTKRRRKMKKITWLGALGLFLAVFTAASYAASI